MNRLYCKALLLMMCASVAFTPSIQGRQLEVGEALKLASQQLTVPSTSGSSLLSPFASESLIPDHTISDSQGNRLVYIANAGEGKGFIIASADDSFPYPLIGYATDGSFSYDRAPEAALEFLQSCADEVERIIAGNRLVEPLEVPAERATAVANFVNATWDQSYPFNAVIQQTTDYSYMTGCVATAMAQVMHYYRYPAQGTGSHSYQMGTQTISADFGSTTYNWDAMPERYSYNWTQENINAVGTLMYHCGVSVDMSYGTGSSGANSFAVPGALSTYFGYDDGMKLHMRRSYTTNDWNQLVYNELSAGRPVLYSGSDASAGGHFFVCSGCDGSDNFFINWGWSGACNGYYNLNALNASGYAFNSDQCIVTGVKPEDGVTEPESFNIIGLGSLALYYKQFGTTYNRGNNTEYVWPTGSSNFKGFMNLDPSTVTVTLGAIFVNTATNEETAVENYGGTTSTLGLGEGKSYFQLHHNQFPQSGTYRMYPAFKDANGTWHKITMEAASPKYIIVDCTSTTLTYNIDTEGLPEIESSFVAPEKLPLGDLSMTVPVTNVGSGDYNGNISLYVKYYSDSYSMLYKKSVYLQPQEGTSVTFTLPSSYVKGNYTAYVADDSGKKIVDTFSFVIYDPNNLEMVYSAMPTLTLGNVEGVTPGDGEIALMLEAPVQCTDGFFSDTPYIIIWKIENGDYNKIKEIYASTPYSIATGATDTFVFKGTIPHVAGDYLIDVYYAGQYYYVKGPEEYLAPLSFTLEDPTPVTSWTLTDGEAYTNTRDYAGVDVTYTREFGNATFHAFYLPYSMQYADWADIGDMYEINNVHQYDTDGDGVLDRTTIEFNRVTGGRSTKPHVPYVFRPNQEHSSGEVTFTTTNTTLFGTPTDDGTVDCCTTRMRYTMTGTYVSLTNLYADNIYALSTDGKFVKAKTQDQELKPFRFYLTVTSRDDNKYDITQADMPASIAMSIDGEVVGDDTSHIIGISGDEPCDDAYYDLTGRRILNPAPGLYIHRGRKVVIN